MGDTYQGDCRVCEKYTDLINGLCAECAHDGYDITDKKAALALIQDRVAYFKSNKVENVFRLALEVAIDCLKKEVV